MIDSLDRKSSQTPHLAALDGLRGIAILIVAWYHIWQVTWLTADVPVFGTTFNFNVFPETGMIGVYLFYFISGFCLFYPYAQTMFDGRPSQTVAMFFYRRVLKIVPSYYLGLIVWVAVGYATFPSLGDAIKQILTHVFFIENFFDDTYGGINGVLYTLAVEVQFYILFPILCWAMMRRPLFIAALTVAGANLYRIVVINDYNAGHELDQLPGCIDLFGTGMFSAWAFRALARRAPQLASRRLLWTVVAVCSFAACYLLLDAIFVRRHDTGWLQNWKLYGASTLALLLVPTTVASLFAFGWWQRVLGNPILLGFSYISYNLYLWHQWLTGHLEAFHPGGFRGWDATMTSPARLVFTLEAFACSIAVAWLVTFCIEQPLLRRKPFVRFVGGGRPPGDARPASEALEPAPASG